MAAVAQADQLSFTVPGQAVPWTRATGYYRRYTPKRQRTYAQRLQAWAAHGVFLWEQGRRRWPLDARYRVELVAFFSDRRPRDTDNLVKIVLDAGQGVLWANDRQVRAHSLELAEVPMAAIPQDRLQVQVTILEK